MDEILSRGKRQYRKHRDKMLVASKTYHEQHREEQNAYYRKYHKEHREDRIRQMRGASLWKNYKLTLAEFAWMVERQAGLCAICTEPMKPGRGTCVDHDHSCCPGVRSCGKCVRALVCLNCNSGMGMLKDDALLFEGARDYVYQSKANRLAAGDSLLGC